MPRKHEPVAYHYNRTSQPGYTIIWRNLRVFNGDPFGGPRFALDRTGRKGDKVCEPNGCSIPSLVPSLQPPASMNRKQLQKLGVPPDCTPPRFRPCRTRRSRGLEWGSRASEPGSWFRRCWRSSRVCDGSDSGGFSRELPAEATPVNHEPISYRTWGTDIDTGAHAQMRELPPRPRCGSGR